VDCCFQSNDLASEETSAVFTEGCVAGGRVISKCFLRTNTLSKPHSA
jgi:hypothetical protein